MSIKWLKLEVLAPLKRKLKPQLNFLHIGKTGGTSIIETGFGQMSQFNDSVQFTPKQMMSWKYNCIAYPHHAAPSAFNNKPNLVFFIREPGSRLESIFYSKKYFDTHSEYARLKKTTKLTKMLFHRLPEFKDFIGALSEENHKYHLESLALMEVIQHFQRDYSFYFGSPENILKQRDNILFIGELEYFKQDSEALLKLVGVKDSQIQPGHRNKSKRPNNSQIDDRTGAKMHELFPKEFNIYKLLHEIKEESGYGQIRR